MNESQILFGTSIIIIIMIVIDWSFTALFLVFKDALQEGIHRHKDLCVNPSGPTMTGDI